MRTGHLKADAAGNLSLVTPLGPLRDVSTASRVPAHLEDEYEELRAEYEADRAEARADRDLAEAEYRSAKGF
jgi:hypothetical protein